MPLGMLGKYERLDVLGHGASGIVYLAKDTLLGRQVALKEVAAQGEDKERILSEARVLDRLRHPNIVQVLGMDEIDGKLVIAMEYVRGRSLLDILRRTSQLPLAQAADIAAQVCDGLAFAHSHRTVHRDVKPANILVTDGGAVKLVDFGLAEVLGTHSLAGGAGTYAYMAPEDFQEDAQSGRPSDIWAVGIVLYEMLAGRRPFQVARPKDPFSWKRVIESGQYAPLLSLRPDAPPVLEALLARALAPDPRARFADAGDMANDLHALAPVAVAGEPLPVSQSLADPPPAGEGGRAGLVFTLPRKGEGRHSDGGEGFLTGGEGFFSGAAVADIDGFLSGAPDHWDDACAALQDGTLARWLAEIGEAPLAEVAAELAVDTERDIDDLLRDFLYRAGLDISDEARRAAAEGARRFQAGAGEEAALLRKRAAHLDPSQALDHAKGGGGSRDVAVKTVTVSAERVDFGVLRRGQTRAARVTVRNEGGGVLQGRVASAPGWVTVEPLAFSTRQRQPLTLTASTFGVWDAPAAYQETVVLETSGGRQEITVLASVLPARRGIGQTFWWYVPLLFVCLLPAVLGIVGPPLAGLTHTAHGHALRQMHFLWKPGFAASGLLCGALCLLAWTADTTWRLRLLPLAVSGLLLGAMLAKAGTLGTAHEEMARAALVQMSLTAVTLLALQAFAIAVAPHRWGSWKLWRWIVGATGLFASAILLRLL